MAKKAFARRYAQAVFQIAWENNTLDKWLSDLDTIAVFGANPELNSLLENPKLSFADMSTIVSGHLTNTSPQAMNLMLMLIQRDRLRIAPDIAGEYRKLLDDFRGIMNAEVTTAVPLSEDERLNLEKRLTAVLGAKVNVKTMVDKNILGGIIARSNGKLIDGSTRSRLAALKRELSGGERR